jgi:hypothetical protein
METENIKTKQEEVKNFDILIDEWRLEDKMKKVSDWSEMYSIELKQNF